VTGGGGAVFIIISSSSSSTYQYVIILLAELSCTNINKLTCVFYCGMAYIQGRNV